MGYWFSDYIGFEDKQNRPNRLILGFRHWDRTGSRKSFVYLKKNVTIPTEFIHREDTKSLGRILEVLEREEFEDCRVHAHISENSPEFLEELAEKPGFEVSKREGDYHVFCVELPKDKRLIDLLPKKFQTGGYDRMVRYEMDILHRKLDLDTRLDEAFSKKQELESYQQSALDIIEAYIGGNAAESKVRSRITRLKNAANGFFSQYSGKFELESVLEAVKQSTNARNLAPLRKFLEQSSGVKEFLEKKVCAQICIDEITNLVYELDSENSFGYNPETGEYELTLNSLNGFDFKEERITADELRQQVFCYIDIEKPFWKRTWEKTDLKRRENLLKTLKKETDESRKERLEKLIARLEDRLTTTIEGKTVKLWEPDYDAKISWCAIIFKLENGEEVRQLHTLYNPGIEAVNGYAICAYDTERDLLDGVIKEAKARNTFAFVAHNAPYDIIQLRDGAERARSEKFDVFIKRVKPRRDVVRDMYQRMRKDVEYIDTCRLAIVFHTYLRSKQPPGNHALECVTNYLLGQGTFKKGLTHDELRNVEFRAINDDFEAIGTLCRYVTLDVEQLPRILESRRYLDVVDRVRELAPNATFTELAFSPRAVIKMHDAKHFERHRNQRFYGYRQKMRENEVQIFKKRFTSLKREWLRESGIPVLREPGRYENVCQCYMPLEEWLKPVLIAIEPRWQRYFARLSEDPVSQFGELQFPKAFLSEALADFYFVLNETERYTSKLGKVSLSQAELEEILDAYCESAEPSLLNGYYGSYNHLKNQYRSIYVPLSGKGRRVIRAAREKEGNLDLEFPEFSDFFYKDNLDLVKLREKASRIEKMLSKGHRIVLKTFLTNFRTLDEIAAKLEEHAEQFANGAVSAHNIVYLHNQRWRAQRRRDQFFARYGLGPFDTDLSIQKQIENGYTALRKELTEKGLIVLMQKGDYLYVRTRDGHIPDFDHSALKLIRVIPEFQIGEGEEHTAYAKYLFDEDFEEAQYDEELSIQDLLSELGKKLSDE